jgi:hypothetical protein
VCCGKLWGYISYVRECFLLHVNVLEFSKECGLPTYTGRCRSFQHLFAPNDVENLDGLDSNWLYTMPQHKACSEVSRALRKAHKSVYASTEGQRLLLDLSDCPVEEFGVSEPIAASPRGIQEQC